MTCYKIKKLKILCCCLSIWFIILTTLIQFVNSSEFPERECCDLTPTTTVNSLPVPPGALPTDKTLKSTQSTIQIITVGRSGSNIKVASAILNCILARQLCFEDSSCSAILEIIPRVCGPIPVSCSTVTVTKCQAALRTLQAFQFFRPTCLCKEPGMDPDCNHFRDFLFDHPCGFVLKKAEKDPYPIDALPTCNHALSVCQQERKCLKLFEDFKTHCKVRDNKCKMESRDACHDSWTNLRLSPMFGCICPNNHMKKRCDRIFSVVNHNPCVDRLIFFPNGLTPKLKQRLEQRQSKYQRNKFREMQRYYHKNNTMPKIKYNEQQQKQHQPYGYEPINNNSNKQNTQNEGNKPAYHQQKTFKSDVGEGDKIMINNTEDNNDNYYNNSRERDNHSKVYNEKDNEDYDDYDDHIRAEIYSNYPHYLHPPSWGLNNPLVLASHSPHTYDKVNSDTWLSGEIETSLQPRKYWLDEQKSEEKKPSLWSHYYTNTQTQTQTHHPKDHLKQKDVVIVVDTNKANAISIDSGTIKTARLDKDNIKHIQRQTYYTHNNEDYHKRYAEYNHNAADDDVIFIMFGNKTYDSPSKITNATTNNQTEIYIINRPTTYNVSTALPKINQQQHNQIITTKNNITTASDDLTTHHHANNKNYFKSKGFTYAGPTIDERVKAMGMDAKLHQKLFEDNLALIDTPLIVKSSIHYPGLGTVNYNVNNNNNGFYYHHTQQSVLTYPYNISEFLHRHMPTNESPLDVINTGGQDLEVDLSTEIIKQHFQSTCHTALNTCREDPSCLSSLQPMLMHCEIHQCNRNACMNSLQLFYKGPHEDLNLDVAFCLCKKTPNRQDACMIAQERLHPVCAQQPTDMQQQGYALPPLCHAIAEVCKENRECRLKLEYYEQACAVDSVTKKCAGRPSGCRLAIVGILGTMLRTTCTCQGADPQYLYHCIGWRRLLWMNPCVVEAQKDFHMKRLTEMGFLTTSTTAATVASVTTTTSTHAPSSTMITKTSHHTPSLDAALFTHSTKDERKLSNHLHMPKEKSQSASVEHNYNEQPTNGRNNENKSNGNDDYHNTHSKKMYNNKGNNFTNSLSNRTKNYHNVKHFYNIEANVTASPIPSSTMLNTVNGNAITTKSSRDGTNNDNNWNGNDESIGSVVVDFDDQVVYVEATEFAATDPTIRLITPNTTTATTTTPKTRPPRNCVVQRPQQADQLIRESTSKRIYTLDDVECSELCSCGESLTLTCHALCVPFSPCRTALAFYSHASPAYQAFRGRCLCYSGRFICMKPPLGEYTLPGGLFLMLGYSSADEALLRPHTNLGVQDAVRVLQQYITSYVDNQTQCTLTLLNMTDENLIIAARLPHDVKLKTVELLHKERDECIPILKTIAHHINSEHHELQSHRLLSIFKLAEVEVVWPEINRTTQLYNNYKTYIILMLICLLLSQPIMPVRVWGQLRTFEAIKDYTHTKQKSIKQSKPKQQQLEALST